MRLSGCSSLPSSVIAKSSSLTATEAVRNVLKLAEVVLVHVLITNSILFINFILKTCCKASEAFSRRCLC